MNDREHLLKLMHVAFLDIRMASYSQDLNTCFVLADIFHNIPLQIVNADKSGIGYTDIINYIHKRCEEKKCIAWLDNAHINIAKLP